MHVGLVVTRCAAAASFSPSSAARSICRPDQPPCATTLPAQVFPLQPRSTPWQRLHPQSPRTHARTHSQCQQTTRQTKDPLFCSLRFCEGEVKRSCKAPH
eukprot:COSAG01_NODE_2020_length_8634_cov_4.835735_8_plen_100_part_00